MSRQMPAGSPAGYARNQALHYEPRFQATSSTPLAARSGSVASSSPEIFARKRPAVSLEAVVGGCALLLLALTLPPLWAARTLAADESYAFWHGPAVPRWLCGSCVGTVALFLAAVALYLAAGTCRFQARSEQTVVILANVFISLLGLSLLLASLPLSRQAVDTYANLTGPCDFSLQSHRLYEFSQVLQNMRRTPGCLQKPSVEDCPGYEPAPPYTSLLKAMETDFSCTGFCDKPSSGRAGRAAPAPGGGDPAPRRADEPRAAGAPPALFSAASHQAPCAPAAAEHVRDLAGRLGVLAFLQGILVVLLAAVLGCLTLLGLCQSKDHAYSFS